MHFTLQSATLEIKLFICPCSLPSSAHLPFVLTDEGCSNSMSKQNRILNRSLRLRLNASTAWLCNNTVKLRSGYWLHICAECNEKGMLETTRMHYWESTSGVTIFVGIRTWRTLIMSEVALLNRTTCSFLIKRTQKRRESSHAVLWPWSPMHLSAFQGVITTMMDFIIRWKALDVLFSCRFQPNREISACFSSFSYLISATSRRWCISLPRKDFVRNWEATLAIWRCLQNNHINICASMCHCSSSPDAVATDVMHNGV